MHTTDIDRVRSDLSTVRRAVGDDPGVTQQDVHLNIALAVVGLTTAAVMAVWPAAEKAAWAVLTILFAVFCGAAFVQARRRRGHEPVRYRHQRSGWIGLAVFCLLVLPMYAAREAFGLSASAATAMAFFTAAVCMLVVAATLKGQFALVFSAVPVLVLAFLIPNFSEHFLLAAACAVSGVAAGLTAAYQAWVLKRTIGARHEQD
ncbi:MAG: hypothetical protein AAF800_13590 [Planctomycetota bacterium]